MDSIARVRRLLYASLTRQTRVKIALRDILISMQNDWLRDSLNKALHAEFDKGGVELDEDFDFHEIIHKAVTSRVNPRDPMYDDLYQEVAMNLLDRRKSDGIKKEWIRKALNLQKHGHMRNLAGFLATSTRNLVRDVHRALVTRRNRELHLEEGDEDTGGIDISRRDTGGHTPEDYVSAESLFNSIMNGLHDDRSKQILQFIVDKGIKGFLRGKGISALAEMLDTSPTMATYYRDKVFKPDLKRALRRLGDRDLIERAGDLFASATQHPMVKLCDALDEIGEDIQDVEI